MHTSNLYSRNSHKDISPLFHARDCVLRVGEYDSAERISSEITQVAEMLSKIAKEILPYGECFSFRMMF